MADLRLGSSDVLAAYLGGTEAVRVYFGSVLLLDNAAGGTLVAQYNTGKTLVNAATLSAYSLAGGDADQYDDGTSGDRILAESIWYDGTAMAAGDVLGVPYMWDTISEQGLGYTTGVPGTGRDTGMTGFDASNYPPNFALGLSGTSGTIAIHLTTTSTTASNTVVFGPDSGSATLGTGVLLYTNGGSNILNVSLRNAGTSVDADTFAASKSTEYWVILSYDGSTLTVRQYDSTGTYLRGVSLSGTVDMDGDVYRIGALLNALQYADDMVVHRFLVFDAALSTAAMDDVADGTDVTGGSTVIIDSVGLRSGCYVDGATTELPIETGAGASVTAEVD